ncbi:hypothetical protein [Salana multivorans]
MASTSQALIALARAGAFKIPPAAWDALIPKSFREVAATRGIIIIGGRQVDVDLVALNPQPIPPGELEIGASLVTEVVRSAIASAGTDGQEGAAKFLSYEIDDWCGTGWPHKWPKPKPKLDDRLVLLGGALAAAELAAGFEGAMAEALGTAIDQLVNTALG